MNMQGMTERNLRGVNLNLLVAFDALMAERNVTRAAQNNGLSQSAMSKALNRLRHLLEDRLFELRDGRMEPTPRALELAGPIHGALSEISRSSSCPVPSIPDKSSGRCALPRSTCTRRPCCRRLCRVCGVTRRVSI